LIIEIQLRDSELNALLPGMILGFVTLPLSLILDPLTYVAPALLHAPLVQLGLLTLCGGVQAGLVWWFAGPLDAPQRSTLRASGANRLPK
jgi:hypothetical protein